MKTVTTALDTLLTTSDQFWFCDLYTFTLIDGTVLRSTSADVDIIYGGNTFIHTGPLFTRGKSRVVIGMQVDTLDVTVHALPTDLLYGIAWLSAVRNGALDGATLTVERAYASEPGAVIAGTLIQFFGAIANTDVSSTTAQMRVTSMLYLLNIQMPRNLYQPGCIHTLYDPGCGVNKAAVSATGAITSTSTAVLLNTGLTGAIGRYTLGELIFTSGVLSGQRRTIKSHAATGVLGLSYPLTQAPAIGDTLTAYPGCDKKYATCGGTFTNQANFRAYPNIPVPETAF